jgi:hypothetical protein
MQFYMGMAIVYLITTIAWSFLLYRYRDGLLTLQVCVFSSSLRVCSLQDV